MEWAALILNFIENIVGHLAWPAVIVIAILVFRQQFQNAIDSLTARLVKITTPAGEADFQPAGQVEDLSVTSADIQETKLPPVPIESSNDGTCDRGD